MVVVEAVVVVAQAQASTVVTAAMAETASQSALAMPALQAVEDWLTPGPEAVVAVQAVAVRLQVVLAAAAVSVALGS